MSENEKKQEKKAKETTSAAENTSPKQNEVESEKLKTTETKEIESEIEVEVEPETEGEDEDVSKPETKETTETKEVEVEVKVESEPETKETTETKEVEVETENEGKTEDVNTTEAKETAETESKPETKETTETKAVEAEVEVENNAVTKPETTETKKAKRDESDKSSKEDSDNNETASSDDEDDSEREDDDNGIPMKDFQEMNLDALTEELQRLMKAHEVKEIRNHARDIKTEFDAKFDEERELKKENFLDDGGNIIDFSYSTATEKKFNKLYFEYKENRDNYYKQVRKNLSENLERRLAIIEELKSMIGVGTNMNANFNQFKKLQERWRKAGPVPRNDYKNTWDTYHHHVEHFYDFLHLDREFRELDYKHNLEQKLKIVARAEELAEETNINRAFRELQSLHKMWKEDVGPVAREYSDPVWEKFSEATRKIHENRRAYFAKIDEKKEGNLEAKQEIIAKIEELEKGGIKSHRQAQQTIKEFQGLRDQFFKAGKVPRNNNQEVWSAFKQASRGFNHIKNEFYKNLKKEQYENLEKKRELIKIADEHKDSDDFETVTPLMKKIQSDWKKVGFVQRSKSDKLWKQFKAACNHYFERLHSRQDEKTKIAMEAFEKRTALLDEVKAMEMSGERDTDLPKIKATIETWKTLGAVPHNKKYIEGKFNKALDKLFDQLDVNRKEVEMLKYENRLQSLEKADDDEKIQNEAAFLRKKIDQTTNEVRQLETNLEFFNNADKNNPLMKNAFQNIEKHKQQLETWKAKLQRLRNL